MRFYTTNIGSTSLLRFAANLLRYGGQDLPSLWRSATNRTPICHILERALASVVTVGKTLPRLALPLAILAVCSCHPALLQPFRSVDHVHFSLANAATDSMNYRISPATIHTGKRSLTLEDCKRTALARNLELQVARADEFTKAAIRDSNRKKVLPHLIFAGELSERDNYGYSFSDVIGQEGLHPSSAEAARSTGVTNYSVGHERGTWRYNLELQWSPTDAALAYYLAKSSSNDRLRAHYQKVRVAQRLIGTVEAAYFRLLSLQRLLPMARKLNALRKKVLRETEHLYEQKMKAVEDYYQANQNLLRAARIVLGIEDELGKQRNVLATAMGLSPDTSGDGGFYVLGSISKPSFRDSIAHMEMAAVRNRPESYEVGLNHLNSIHDVRRTMVKFFPRLTAFWKYTRDKDKFLYNKDWKDVGVRVYFDITEWMTNWDESRAARSNALKTNREVGTIALGITSQVRVAALRYFRALKEVDNAESSLRISRKVLATARARDRGDDITRLKLLEVEASTLQEKIDRFRSIGEANATLAELRSEMGTNYRQPHPRD